MLKYLKEPHPGTRMAIFGLTTRLILLQGFTSDPELLRAVLNGKKGGPKGSVLMTDTVSGDNPGADDPMMDMAQDASDAMGNTPDAALLIANLQQFEAETHSFQLQLRARMTLDAFNLLARYLTALPGRKNLIWFSGSFPITILPDGDLQDPFSIVASSADEFRETTGLLSRGQVAVYPIDARGLMVTPMQSVGNSGRTYATNPRAFAKDNSTFFQNTANEHGTMESMAEATGGQAFVNTNGLKEAVEKAVNAGSNYYTLTYTPTNQQWKGEFRRIQINLARRGLNLAYRRGYLADDPNTTPRNANPQSLAAARRPPTAPSAQPWSMVVPIQPRSPSSPTSDPALTPLNQMSRPEIRPPQKPRARTAAIPCNSASMQRTSTARSILTALITVRWSF
jgi:VWFA-related protein